jgi:hypothetical protein
VTIDEARLLPPTISVGRAGEVLGVGRTQAYQLIRDGRWPVPDALITIGERQKVKTVPLLRYVGIELREGGES